MPRPRSKKDLASDHIEEALSHVGKALSLLGGRTRALSSTQNPRIFTVRKYLESIESRLGVCQDLIQVSNIPVVRLIEETTPSRDEFEAEYEANRVPEC